MPEFRVFRLIAGASICATTIFAPAQTHTLQQITFTGAPSYSQSELLTFTGLAQGAPATQQQIQAAAQRLGDTNLFDQVNFSGNDKGIVFSLTPALPASLLPIRFSNFIWWHDDELDRLLKKQVPLYRNNGIPTTGSVTDGILAALKSLLVGKGLANAEVAARPGASRIGGSVDHLFVSIESPSIRIHFAYSDRRIAESTALARTRRP